MAAGSGWDHHCNVNCFTYAIWQFVFYECFWTAAWWWSQKRLKHVGDNSICCSIFYQCAFVGSLDKCKYSLLMLNGNFLGHLLSSLCVGNYTLIISLSRLRLNFYFSRDNVPRCKHLQPEL